MPEMWKWVVGAAIAASGALVMPGGVARDVAALKARELVSALAAGHPERAPVEWTAAMAKRLPTPLLREQWSALTREAGGLERIGEIEVSPVDGRYRLVAVGLEFEREAVIARVTFDSENRIAGLYFLPKE